MMAIFFQRLRTSIFVTLLVILPVAAQQPSEPSAEDEERQQVVRIMQLSDTIASGKLVGPNLAEALRRRGVMLGQMLSLSKALTDLDRSINLVSDNGQTYVDRGVVHHAMNHPDDALKDFAQAIQLVPDFSHAYFSRGHVYYYQGKFAEAMQDFGDGGALAKDDEYLYMVIWHYLAASRAGRDAKGVLAEMVRGHDLNKWPGAVLRMLQGEVAPEAVLNDAKGTDSLSLRMHQCEARFYVAQYHLLQGDKERAKKEFEATVETKVKPFIEYQFALRELERL